jgi:transposase
MKFGRSSEQLDHQLMQMQLTLEDLESSLAQKPEAVRPPPKGPTQKPIRRALPEHLPRKEIVHESPCACPACGGELRRFGEDVSEMLEYVPESYQVIRHVRPKFSCAGCQKIVQASAPSRPIARGLAGPGFLAHVLVAKYADHLPLYRQSQIYAREGVHLDRSTLADWVGGASVLLEPLVNALGRYVLGAQKLHGDDTPVPVLCPGRGTTKQGRLWTYVRDDRPAGSSEPPAVLFRYTPDRKAIHPQTHLQPFLGVLQADAYAGFERLYGERIKEAACWAHVRRKFYDIHVAQTSPIAAEALDRIGRLYAIETEIRGRPATERAAARQARAGPELEALHTWLHAVLTSLSKKSELAVAIRYALSRWASLIRYRDDGRLEIDTDVFDKNFSSHLAPPLGRSDTPLWRLFLPCGSKASIVLFSETEPFRLFVADSLQAVVARGAFLIPPAARSGTGLQLELSQLPLQKRGSRPCIVLLLRKHVPNKDGELSSSGYSGHLLATLRLDSTEERSKRTWRRGDGPDCFN